MVEQINPSGKACFKTGSARKGPETSRRFSQSRSTLLDGSLRHAFGQDDQNCDWKVCSAILAWRSSITRVRSRAPGYASQTSSADIHGQLQPLVFAEERQLLRLFFFLQFALKGAFQLIKDFLDICYFLRLVSIVLRRLLKRSFERASTDASNASRFASKRSMIISTSSRSRLGGRLASF